MRKNNTEWWNEWFKAHAWKVCIEATQRYRGFESHSLRHFFIPKSFLQIS